MNCIRSYYEACRAEDRDPFYVDDTTWKDLDLDDVYRRLNTCSCTAGEQYLYYMLRRPMDQDTYRRQEELLRLTERDPQRRQRLQGILGRIGCRRTVSVTEAFHPQKQSGIWLGIYILLAVLFPVSLAGMVLLGRAGILLPVLSVALNGMVHEFRAHRCAQEIGTVNYYSSLVVSLRKIQKLKDGELDGFLEEAYGHLKPLHAVIRSGPVTTLISTSDFAALFMMLFLMDLISFERLKKKLAKYHGHLLAIHDAVGQLDASMAVAAYREGTECCAFPQIDYGADHAYLKAEGLVHPLIQDAVPNNADLEQPLLITGSNASGKSTYLKAAALCALMAQTLCTCTCKAYAASPFRIYTSMALADNLLAGESYFIVEIKSLKRILDDHEEGFVLCAVDEVLRGTNTIERIAASAEILKAFAARGFLCLIATHDAELCGLVGEGWRKAHFEETVTEREILFDYQLKPGPAESRNAIRLLKLLGFDEAIVSAADGRANRYAETGKWENDPMNGSGE